MEAVLQSEFPSLARLIWGLVKFVELGAYFAGYWIWLFKRTKYSEREHLLVNPNYSLFAIYGGMLIFLGCALRPLWGYPMDRPLYMSGWILGGLVWVTVLLLGIRPIMQRRISGEPADLHKLHELKPSVAIVMAGFFVGHGMTVGAGLTGDSPTVASGLLSTLCFTLVGILLSIGFHAFMGRLSNVPLTRLVREGDTTAAVTQASYSVSIGFIMYNAIAGDFESVEESIVRFVGHVTLMMGMLVVTLLLANKYLPRFMLGSARKTDGHDVDMVDLFRRKALVPVGLISIAQVAVVIGISNFAL